MTSIATYSAALSQNTLVAAIQCYGPVTRSLDVGADLGADVRTWAHGAGDGLLVADLDSHRGSFVRVERVILLDRDVEGELLPVTRGADAGETRPLVGGLHLPDALSGEDLAVARVTQFELPVGLTRPAVLGDIERDPHRTPVVLGDQYTGG